MDKPIPPQLELEQAKLAAREMHQANSLVQFEQAWKRYLHHLERTWYKANTYFGADPDWRTRKSHIEQQRNRDPLLRYLIAARGADEHSIDEITDRKPGYVAINPVEPGGTLRIDRLEINNSKMHIHSRHPFKLESRLPHLVLLPIPSRGKVVIVPTTHLGFPIDQNDILGIAQQGINFYETILNEALVKQEGQNNV